MELHSVVKKMKVRKYMELEKTTPSDIIQTQIDKCLCLLLVFKPPTTPFLLHIYSWMWGIHWSVLYIPWPILKETDSCSLEAISCHYLQSLNWQVRLMSLPLLWNKTHKFYSVLIKLSARAKSQNVQIQNALCPVLRKI